MAETASTPEPIDLEEVKKVYPLHIHIWNNDYEALKTELEDYSNVSLFTNFSIELILVKLNFTRVNFFGYIWKSL